MVVDARHILCLKSVLAFQTLTMAMLGKWATTHERIVFLGKNCSRTFLPRLIWLQVPITWLHQFVWTSENTFWFFKMCWWLTGLSRLYDASLVSILMGFNCTTRTALCLIRSTKLSPVRQGSYLAGWLNMNTLCCNNFFFLFSFFPFLIFFPLQGDISDCRNPSLM